MNQKWIIRLENVQRRFPRILGEYDASSLFAVSHQPALKDGILMKIPQFASGPRQN
jgi:hypothetical protein